MSMGEGRRRGYNDFSLRMSSFLSKRWVCVVENLSSVSLSEWSLMILWVMRVYIVWVKGKKVTLKMFYAKRFVSILWEGLTRETLVKFSRLVDSLASNMCFSRALFKGTLLVSYSRTNHETILILHFKLDSSPA